MSAGASRDDLLDALRAAREAIDIPSPATVGDEKVYGRILADRTRHLLIMLRNITDPKRTPDVPWDVAYLRSRLAEHPAEGYKTWAELAAETEARKSAEGEGRS